jgi:hypothetical protein
VGRNRVSDEVAIDRKNFRSSDVHHPLEDDLVHRVYRGSAVPVREKIPLHLLLSRYSTNHPLGEVSYATGGKLTS